MQPPLKLKNVPMNNLFPQVNEDSEYIDLTQDESSSEEKDNFNLLLGKKSKRQKSENKDIDKFKKYSSFDNSFDNEEELYSSNKININNKNNNINNINCEDNINNNNYEAERDELLKLIKLEGFNKIFTLITKAKFDSRNPIEKKLEQIIFNIGLLRTSLILLQLKHTLLPEPSNDNSNNKNINSSNEIELNKRESHIQELENKGYETSDHLHKENDGKIYRYKKNHLRVNNIYMYYCADKKCKSRGIYKMKNMEFRVVYQHTIPHEEHNYIKNPYLVEQHKEIFDDFSKRSCKEAHIFKNKGGDKLVKWYNNCKC